MGIKKRILSAAVCASMLVAAAVPAYGATKITMDNRNPYEEPILIRATCYTSDEGAITYSGQEVRKGIIAGKEDWLGSVALLYSIKIEDGKKVPGELIGIYEVLDTGAGIDTDGDGKGDTLPAGQSIDVFQETEDLADEWIATYGDYVMLKLVNGKG